MQFDISRQAFIYLRKLVLWNFTGRDGRDEEAIDTTYKTWRSSDDNQVEEKHTTNWMTIHRRLFWINDMAGHQTDCPLK